MPDETPNTPATPATAAVATTPPAGPGGTATPTTPGPGTGAHQTATGNVILTNEAYQTLAALQPKIAELESRERAREDAARTEQLRLMAEQGKAQEALREAQQDADRRVNTERTALGAARQRAARYAIDGELAQALQGHKLASPSAADQLRNLFRGHFSADEQGDTYTVRTPGGQTPADFIAAQLATTSFAHFLMPGSTGGTGGTTTGAQGAGPTAPANPTQPEAPATLSDAVLLHFKGQKAALPTDVRKDMSQPMGLRRAR